MFGGQINKETVDNLKGCRSIYSFVDDSSNIWTLFAIIATGCKTESSSA